MALVTGLIRDIAQLVRPCPSSVLTGALVRAARQLASESRWLQYDYELTLTAGIRAYDLTPPVLSGQAASELQVVDLAWAGHWLDASLAGTQWTKLGKMGPADFNPNLANDCPLRVAYTPEGEVQFDPIPDQAYPVRLRVAYQPIELATDLPDALMVKWRDGIEAGALAFLYALDGQPWANPNKQARNERIFAAAIGNARANVAMDYQSGSRRATPRAFFPASGFLLR